MSKVGKIVKLQHAGSRNGGLRKCKPRYIRIELEYLDGDIDIDGELWYVRPSKDPKAQFETYERDNNRA